jgi:hypothetical protein
VLAEVRLPPEKRFWGSKVERKLSALEWQAGNALLRVRKLPIGADRNDLRARLLQRIDGVCIWIAFLKDSRLSGLSAGATTALRATARAEP